MAHRKLEFIMPAPASVVFDAFHYHAWRVHWDSLVSRTQVEGGAPCPSVGAISENNGAGLLGGISMRTRFVSYEPGVLAAASMIEPSFPFSRWAASMRHAEAPNGFSVLVYTYTFDVMPARLKWALEPVVDSMFLRATRKRFQRLQVFLAGHAHEVREWQEKPLTVHATHTS
ncbi:SRPBCC family protein [Variovorax sp. VNK109]|uniref:SRPBCC family protein n=1 Tax=Variovorax sp. VNK109 TaxID=3400919 RepID=UPI003C09D2D6